MVGFVCLRTCTPAAKATRHAEPASRREDASAPAMAIGLVAYQLRIFNEHLLASKHGDIPGIGIGTCAGAGRQPN